MLKRYFKLVILFVFLGTSFSYAGINDTDTKVKVSSRGKLIYNKREGKIKVYIEGIRLDMDYMRRNMQFVDFVTEPAVADVHIILNSRVSGSGGLVYSLMYNNKTLEPLPPLQPRAIHTKNKGKR